jgi:predicted aldo/keto reductase-like oxidoreductase
MALKYRNFGKLNWSVSALGFGAMRLPIKGKDRGDIDEVKSIQMIKYAIDHGVNYIDTAYPYHNGKSEMVVGKVLQEGSREKVRIATKMPIRLLESEADLDRIFDEQLHRLQTDYIDFYLLHGLRQANWLKVQEFNVLKWAEKEIAEGRIGYLGFSFHDTLKMFKEIIDGYGGWTFCQIQYNYVDTEYQAGTQGLKYAAAKGLGVVVMEPIQGGNLSVTPSEEIQTIWDESESQRTPAEWALQWVWNQPEVSVALSGMSTMAQVVENVRSASRSGPGTLTHADLALLSRVREKYLEYGFIGCTGCRYCISCPEGVAIPDILSLCNEYYTKRGNMGAQKDIISKYLERIPAENRAEMCAKCGECEDQCPQHLPIRKLLEQAVWLFKRAE